MGARQSAAPLPLKKLWSPRRRAQNPSANAVVDVFAFVLSGVAALWLAWLVISEGFSWGWSLVPFFALFWVVLAYLVLPRLHKILTSIYVPDYFMGRARTSDGLLGDPINVALLGSEAQIHEAMTRAAWIKADEITVASSWRIFTSTLFKRSYDEAPVSPLLLFGRQQDMAYQQEVQDNPARRHHVRLWRCPEGWMLPGGHRAHWLAAGTFDRAVGFSLFTLQITHKVDADTDAERDYIVSGLAEHNPDVVVRVLKDFSTGYHSRNGGGDSIETDGDLPVVDVQQVPLTAIGEALGPDVDARRAARAARRPVSTILGVLLMVLRAVVGAATVATLMAERQDILRSVAAGASTRTGMDAEQVQDLALVTTVVLAALGVAVYLLLAYLVFRGSNGARIAAMAYSGALMVVTAIAFFQGQVVTLSSNIFGLPLDILVLMALSERSSRIWARRQASHTGADFGSGHAR